MSIDLIAKPMNPKKIYCALLLLLVSYSASPQANVPVRKIDSVGLLANSAPKDKIVTDNYGFLDSYEFILSDCVLVFGLILILFELHLIKANRINQEHAVKFIVVTLIIVSTLFLITAGYNNNQIAPATGLLGTIAGYLLGKSNSDKRDEK